MSIFGITLHGFVFTHLARAWVRNRRSKGGHDYLWLNTKEASNASRLPTDMGHGLGAVSVCIARYFIADLYYPVLITGARGRVAPRIRGTFYQQSVVSIELEIAEGGAVSHSDKI